MPNIQSQSRLDSSTRATLCHRCMEIKRDIIRHRCMKFNGVNFELVNKQLFESKVILQPHDTESKRWKPCKQNSPLLLAGRYGADGFTDDCRQGLLTYTGMCQLVGCVVRLSSRHD